MRDSKHPLHQACIEHTTTHTQSLPRSTRNGHHGEAKPHSQGPLLMGPCGSPVIPGSWLFSSWEEKEGPRSCEFSPRSPLLENSHQDSGDEPSLNCLFLVNKCSACCVVFRGDYSALWWLIIPVSLMGFRITMETTCEEVCEGLSRLN